MKTAALRDQVGIMAAKKEQTVKMDFLHLTLHFDRDQLERQLKVFGDVLGNPPSNTVQERAATLSKLHPQTKTLFKEVEHFIRLSRLSLSCIIGENIVRSLLPEGMITHNYGEKKTDASCSHACS